MSAEGLSSGVEGRRRRWAFAGRVFDEANWTLTVDGRRVAVETKPLELLRELLLHAGDLVPKDQLMDNIWPNVEVVEASLPTAVGKLRRALSDDRINMPIIETVSRRGYRLAVPVEVEYLPNWSDPQMPSIATAASEHVADTVGERVTGRGHQSVPTGRRLPLFGGLAIVYVLLALGFGTAQKAPTSATAARTPFDRADVFAALRKVDVETIEDMLAAGWNPNQPLDADGNNALNILLNNCEWDLEHDPRKLLLAARTLMDGGNRLDHRNSWGDTPYSIAKAERYCGPDHPVTKSIRAICYTGFRPLADRCLASYEVAETSVEGPPAQKIAARSTLWQRRR